MEEFIKFSLHKDHPTTASGSVTAPKEEFDKHKFFDQVSAINAKKDLVIESLQSENTALREALKETTNKLMESVSMLDIIRDDMTRDDIPTGGYEPTDWSIMSINDLIQSSQAIIERARKLILK